MRGKRCYGWSLENDEEVLWQRKKPRKRKMGKKMRRLYKEKQKAAKKGGQEGAKKGQNVVVTYRTSSGLKQGTLELQARRTFRAGFVSRQTQTTPNHYEVQ